MQFGLAFGYVLNRTGGFANLLMITLCQFIPVVGPIVLLGYRAEVSLALIHDREIRRHPKFDFNRFGEYLGRGIWPFLIGLVLAFGMIFCIGLTFGAALLLTIALKQPVIGMIVDLIGYAMSIFGFMMISAPMTFHAEITKRFDLGGAFRFAKDFWLTVGGQVIITGIIYVFMAWFVMILGLLCLIVGIYPAQSLVQMAGQHLLVQLYLEYLDRGGKRLREYEEDDEYYDDDDDEYDDDRR